MISAFDHRERLAAGIRLMDAGRIPEAVEVFRYILHQSPSDPDAICGLAGTALARRAPQEAFDLLAKARPIHPQHAGLLAMLSSAHSALGRFQEALVCIDAAIRIAPDDPGHRFTYVQLLLALNRPDDALAAIIAAEESLGERGRTPDLMNAKGMLLMQRGESRAGMEAFRAAFEVDPDRVEFAHNLAVALHGLGYAEEALRFAERAYLNDPGDVGYRLGFARCLISLGRLQEAKEMLQTAQALAPQDVAAIGLLAGLLISSGDPDTALAMCANLVRQKNQSPDACLMLAQNLRLAGRFEQALAVLPHAKGASETKDVAEALESEIHLCLGRTISTESIGDAPIKTFTIGRTGLAEAILCSRWLTPDMTLHAPGELMRLFEGCGQVPVTPHASEEAAPILALLSMDRRTPPAPDAFFPYLRLPDEVVRPWRDALAKLPGPRIGLIWDHAAPGVSLGSLWPALEGVGTVISLAANPLRHDLQEFPHIRDGGINIADIFQLAAAIAALDFVVAPDSIAAHLAGAMGKPGIVLVPAGYPWYWRAENGRSVWYPSLDVLTQTHPGNWQASLTALPRRLSVLTAERGGIEAPSSPGLVDALHS